MKETWLPHPEPRPKPDGWQAVTRKACPSCGRRVDVVAIGDNDSQISRHLAADRAGWCNGSTARSVGAGKETPQPKKVRR